MPRIFIVVIPKWLFHPGFDGTGLWWAVRFMPADVRLQKGHLNFNLDRLKPTDGWEVKMERLMMYYEHDSQLRDILITGGCTDESNQTLEKILDAVSVWPCATRT